MKTGTSFRSHSHLMATRIDGEKFFKKKFLIYLGQWSGYFILLLILTMPLGLDTKFVFSWKLTSSELFIRPTTSVKDIMRDFGPTDQASYAKAAVMIAQDGTDDKELLTLLPYYPTNSQFELDRSLANWPRGFPTVEAIFIKLVGVNGPLVLCLICLTCASWSLVLWNLFMLAKLKIPCAIAYLMPLILCFSGIFRYNLLGIGVISSESISIAFLCLSFLLLIRSAIEKSNRLATSSGIWLALAAYCRGQIEVFAVIFSVYVIVAVAFSAIRSIWNKQKNQATLSTKKPLHLLFLSILVFNCCTVPYRAYNLYRFHTPCWQRLDYYWKLNWLIKDKIVSNYTGIMLPAQIDSQLHTQIERNVRKYGDNYYPDQFYKKCTILTFLRHPFKWIHLKAMLIPATWFYPNYACHNEFLRGLTVIEDWSILICWILCVILISAPFILNRRQPVDIIYLFLFLALCSATLLTIIFIHLEPRYFFVLKFCTFILLFALLCTKVNFAQHRTT